jgi:DNA-directed RNA polymerase specialized sigma24 family protein
VQLRVVDELDDAAVVAEFDCSEAAARRRVHRGLARLNRLLEVAP